MYIHNWSQPVHKCGREEGFSHHLPMVQTWTMSGMMLGGEFKNKTSTSWTSPSSSPQEISSTNTCSLTHTTGCHGNLAMFQMFQPKMKTTKRRNRHLSAMKTGLYLSSMFMKNAKRNRTNKKEQHQHIGIFKDMGVSQKELHTHTHKHTHLSSLTTLRQRLGGTKGSNTPAAKEQCYPVHWWLTGLDLHWRNQKSAMQALDSTQDRQLL